MARFYEIKTSDAPSRSGFGRRDFETEDEYEAYECGYENGYDAAMDEMNGKDSRRVSYKRSRYRDDDDDIYMMNSRRRRDSRGRYM